MASCEILSVIAPPNRLRPAPDLSPPCMCALPDNDCTELSFVCVHHSHGLFRFSRGLGLTRRKVRAHETSFPSGPRGWPELSSHRMRIRRYRHGRMGTLLLQRRGAPLPGNRCRPLVVFPVRAPWKSAKRSVLEFFQNTRPMESGDVAVPQGWSDLSSIHQVLGRADTQLKPARKFRVIEKNGLVCSGLLDSFLYRLG